MSYDELSKKQMYRFSRRLHAVPQNWWQHAELTHHGKGTTKQRLLTFENELLEKRIFCREIVRSGVQMMLSYTPQEREGDRIRWVEAIRERSGDTPL